MKLLFVAAVFGMVLGARDSAAPLKHGPKTVVTVYLGTECPASQSYVSRLNSLYETHRGKGVKFVALFPQASDNAKMISSFAKEWKLRIPCEQDLGGMQAKKNRVTVVPYVMVHLNEGPVLYRGAIDDNKVSSLAKKHYLADALDAIFAGRPIKVPSTEAIGCVLSPDPEPQPMLKATYADSVGKILNDHCVQCHRPGEVAPFSLIGYDQAKNWSKTIANVTEARKMPPWKAIAGIGEFRHENRLTDEEVETLKTWADKGAPRGDKKTEPKAPVFKAGWALGEPDMILQPSKPFKVSADGTDEYWHFVLKPQIKEPVYVQATDVRPGNKRIVHHVILWIDEKKQADKILEEKGVNGAYLSTGWPGFMPDNSLGGWAPGMMPERTTPDSGFLIKPGSNVVLEVHYHKSGKEETDQTKVGLYFAKDSRKVTKPLEIAWLANPMIRIKPGLKAQRFTQTIPIPVDVELYSLMPHMHMLGRAMSATLIHPDGRQEPLIQVDDWDFNWQFTYALKTPKILKRGSKVRIEAEYDNSADNPNNPNNPPKLVRWGEQTTDEMMLLVAAIHVPNRKNFAGTIGD